MVQEKQRNDSMHQYRNLRDGGNQKKNSYQITELKDRSSERKLIGDTANTD